MGSQELEGALEMREGGRRVDYRRHGFGRPAFAPAASRSIQR
jgi:hypothetical protein